MQQLAEVTSRVDLCDDCVKRETARIGAGWFCEPLLEGTATCESCGRLLDHHACHPDPEAHRSG